MKPFARVIAMIGGRRIIGVFPVSVGDARGHTFGCECARDA